MAGWNLQVMIPVEGNRAFTLLRWSILSQVKLGAALAAMLHFIPAPSFAEGPVLNVFARNAYIAPDTVAQFEKLTGVKVRYEFYETSQTMEASLLSGHAGYDLVVVPGDFLAQQAKTGLFAALDRSLLPNLANIDVA